ncbi:MAG: PEP-CTERM sorting domain-containing protein [Opitutales bacterium]|nr:PEP-CTERM sorting domain-containing protein [Opitutales bacterium]
MKKYITIAALLAAGSAFANATDITWTVQTPTYYGDSGNQWVGVMLFKGDIGLDEGISKTVLDFSYNTGNKTLNVTSTDDTDVLGTYLTEVKANVASAKSPLSYTFSDISLENVEKVTLVWAAPYQYATLSELKALSYSVIDVPSNLSSSWEIKFESINLKNNDPVKVSPIPEPSTFGLLAGLGALALVGTRRRRR